jgi:hypothetical protein
MRVRCRTSLVGRIPHGAAGETNRLFATIPDELLTLTGGTETDLARDS